MGESSIPVGVLGDSDSHSYHDRVWSPAARGGAYRANTFQWTEVVTKLRGGQLDLGKWGVWGTRRIAARLLDWVGLQGRVPRKEDYRHNFALGGAHCTDLMRGAFRQAPRLVALMDREPGRWCNGVVVVRIGVVSFGLLGALNQLARDPASAPVRAAISNGIEQIKAAVALIHASHPLTRIVLVGILNNADWPPYFDRWRSPEELSNIAAGLDAFDVPLKQLAQADSRIAFFDDRAWFTRHWGARDERGTPDYKTCSWGPGLTVTMTQGDHPSHAVLADGHAGTVWNLLWAQSLVALLNSALSMRIAPITDPEIVCFLESEVMPQHDANACHASPSRRPSC